MSGYIYYGKCVAKYQFLLSFSYLQCSLHGLRSAVCTRVFARAVLPLFPAGADVG